MSFIRYRSVAVERRALFYQLGLKQFGSMHKLVLDPPPSLREMLEIAIEEEDSGIVAAGLESDKVFQVSFVTHDRRRCIQTWRKHASQEAHSRLSDRREMLEEYFSIEISEDGDLQALPLVLPGFKPNLDDLPSFLLCMAFKVRETVALQKHPRLRNWVARSTGGKSSNVFMTFWNNWRTSIRPGRCQH